MRRWIILEDNTNVLILNMSPHALDDLKSVFGSLAVSKYELPVTVFPERKPFFAKLAMENGLLVMNFNISGCEFSLKGMLNENTFSCRRVSVGALESDKGVSVSFLHENRQGTVRISDELKRRLDMWYGYIDTLLEKSRENKKNFRCGEIVYRSEDIVRIRVGELDGVKGLSIGAADEKGEPLYSYGKAEGVENGVLTIRLTGRRKDEIAGGRELVAYDAAAEITCKRMRSGLDRLCTGESVNKRLPEFLFEPSNANKKPGDNVIISEGDLLAENMNPEQIEAVEGVMNAEDLYLIQGPPGTGKTTVIAEICYQNAVRGLKTLVVSQSNLAVDNAISRVMNHADVRVLRKGDSSRVEAEGQPFVEDNVVRTWIGQIAESTKNMADEIDEKISDLEEAMESLPSVMELSESITELRQSRATLESQLYFYKNLFSEAEKKRVVFLRYAERAYEEDDLSATEKMRGYYPEDFIIPNNVYNDIASKYPDMKADFDRVRELEAELRYYNEYTSRINDQFEYIEDSAGLPILARTSYEGEFYYADYENTESIYKEGQRILKAEPSGIKRLIFGKKWKKLAAAYYRRAESFMTSVQAKTIKLCDRIYQIKQSEEYRVNAEGFHRGVDALCEDYDEQLFTVKEKSSEIRMKLGDIDKDLEYYSELIREKTSGKFFSAALKKADPVMLTTDELDRLVSKRYIDLFFRYETWKKLLAQWRESIADKSAKNYGALKRLYIENANVIGITCIQSGTRDFSENYPSFDTVIIDESSKSTPPDIILPMLKGRKIVLVGDQKQLPPYIDRSAYDEIGEDDDSLKELMKVSLFEELYEKADRGSKTMLYRQYRMHRDIAGLVNQFYINSDAGRLESPSEAPKEHMCHGEDISRDDHVLWYDIPNEQSFYEKQQGSSFCNEYEVSCVKKILLMLNHNLAQNGAEKGIGIITFYDAQVKLLESELIYSGFYKRLSNINVRIGSVDRFQGMEEDIIILSFVRNNKWRSIGFARDGRRINVAMSRAKELLVIVGCSENFVRSANEEASEMFRNVKLITERLGGMKKISDISEYIEDIEHTYNKEYVKSAQGGQDVDDDDETESALYGGVNILDRFILKAAYEFRGKKLTPANVSNVLGVAPVFIKNRIAVLCNEKYIKIVNNNINIMEKGVEFVKNN